MTMRAFLLIVVAASAALAVEPDPGSTRVGGGRHAAVPCGAAPSAKTVVGSIISVVSSEASVDSSFAYSGRTLYAGSTVCTSSGGQVRYRLTRDGVTYCNTGTPPNSSRASIYPSADAAVLWSLGSTWCAGARGVRVTFSSVGKLTMRGSDPVAGVVVGKKGETTAKVLAGFLDVSGPGKAGAMILGPGQQVTAPSQGNPTAAKPIELSGGDRVTIADLQFLVPPTRFAPPAIDGSKVLARIFAARTLVIAYDARTSAFAKRYFSVLAKSWGVTATYRLTSSTTAPRLLELGKANVAIVATSTKLPSTLDAVPLFTDPGGGTWQLALARDKAYDAAVRAYFLASLNTGRYASAYRAAYKEREPGYALLRPLLFP
jgi:hypothetical protein